MKNELSKTHRQRLNRALSIADSSSCRQRHGAIIMRGGSVLSVGINSYRTDPTMLVDWQDVSGISWHAEVAAIRAYKGNLEGTTLYVARRGRNGKAAMSKPCDECQKAIRDAGIKKIYYTVDGTIDL